MFKEVDTQFDFPRLERRILDFWDTEHIFQKSIEQRAGKERFVFFEGRRYLFKPFDSLLRQLPVFFISF